MEARLDGRDSSAEKDEPALEGAREPIEDAAQDGARELTGVECRVRYMLKDP
jgi:hypothetical protein